MKDVKAVKCSRCGAPAYADQKLEGFLCPYCGNLIPWAQTRGGYTPNIAYRHRAIPMVEGLLKLTHVGMPEEAAKDPRAHDEMELRTGDVDTALSALDKKTFEAWETRKRIALPCTRCGATIAGYSTQTIFECGYCKNKLMAADVYASGAYHKDMVFGYDHNMYDMALPFAVSYEEAKMQMLRLAEMHPQDFAGQDIAARLETGLKALYLPYRLEDASLKATVETEKGEFTFYHDRINWALPCSAAHDIYLLDALHPWDFGQAAPFSPAFLEGDVRIFAPVNNEARNTALRRLLWRDTPAMVSRAFGLGNVKLLSWVYDFRRHKYAYINLPIWFLDKERGRPGADLQVSMAVNGQTGKTAALLLQADKKDCVHVREADYVAPMSDECTMYSPPVPIAYVKPPFLFRTLSFEEATGKKGGLFKRLLR